jgi:hypothetical protein
LNIYRKVTLVVAFLLVVTISFSINSTSSALLLYDISTVEAGGEEEPFEVLVTVADIEGHCEEEVKITVAYKSDTLILYEGDERPPEEQRADPISSE